MLSNVGWGGGGAGGFVGRLVSKCSGHPMFFLLKKIGYWLCVITRHHAESNNMLLTRNLPFYSDVRQWSHPLHCIVCGLNPTVERVVILNVTCMWHFCFDFIRLHVQWSCYSVVYLRVQVVQINKVDCKLSTKKANNYKQNSWYFWTTTRKSIKPRKSR